MSWGLQNRIARIIRPEDRRTVMLAVDHGYFQGPTTGLVDAAGAIAPLIDYADTLMLTRGVLRNCVDDATATPIVLRVSGGNSVLEDDLSNETLITSVRGVHPHERGRHGDVALHRLGPPASDDREPRQARRRGRALRHPGARRDRRGQGDGARRALPRPGHPHRRRDGRHTSSRRTCARTSRRSSHGCPVPIVIAGGKKLPEREALAAHLRRDRWRCLRRRHGPQHLPERLAGRHDQGRATRSCTKTPRSTTRSPSTWTRRPRAAHGRGCLGRRGLQPTGSSSSARRRLLQQLRRSRSRSAPSRPSAPARRSCTSRRAASAAPTCSSGTACPRRRSCSVTRSPATSSRWARA